MHWCTVAQHVKKKWESLEKLDWNTAGFIGPILLNCVVSFMEDPDPDSGMVTEYIYAILLAISSFTGALCSFHFNLFMTELGVKVRAALTTAVYDNTVTVT